MDFPEFPIVRETYSRYAVVHTAVYDAARVSRVPFEQIDRWLPHHDTGRVPYLGLDLEQILVDRIDRQPFATSLQRLPAGNARVEVEASTREGKSGNMTSISREQNDVKEGDYQRVPIVTEGGLTPPAAAWHSTLRYGTRK